MQPYVYDPHRDAAHQKRIRDGAVAYGKRDFRQAADTYLNAYHQAARWRGQFYALSAYTAVLREHEALATDRDLAALKTITKDKKAPRAHRVLAAFTHGFALWGRGHRHEAVHKYHDGITLADAATDSDKSACILRSNPSGNGQSVWDVGGTIIAEYAKLCKENIATVTNGTVASTVPGQMPQALRTNAWPVTPQNAEEMMREAQRRETALRPRNTACATCGAASKPDGSNLSQCQGCLCMFYCSKDCMRQHWRAPVAPHKAQCRAPSDLRAGDYVKIRAGAPEDAAPPPLRPHFFVLLRKSTDDAGDECWVLRNDGLGALAPRQLRAEHLQRVIVD